MGRPPMPAGERRSKNRTFRVRGKLDSNLQIAAQRSGRSVSEEIEFRLEQSFIEERSSIDTLGFAYGSRTAGLVLTIAEAIKTSEPMGPGTESGVRLADLPHWLDHPLGFLQARTAVLHVLSAAAPPGQFLGPESAGTEARTFSAATMARLSQFGERGANITMHEIAKRGRPNPAFRASLLRRLLGPEIVARISKYLEVARDAEPISDN